MALPKCRGCGVDLPLVPAADGRSFYIDAHKHSEADCLVSKLDAAERLNANYEKLTKEQDAAQDAMHKATVALRMRAEAAESRLENAVIDAVKATVQLGYDHWLTHGTPIRKEDAALVVFDVQRVIGNGKCIHGNGPTCPECRVVERQSSIVPADEPCCKCGVAAGVHPEPGNEKCSGFLSGG